MKLILFILSLPTQNSTARMRVWRALKNCGAAVLRDGVYILPDSADQLEILHTIADDVMTNEGTALIFQADAISTLDIPVLFDRREEYEVLHGHIHQLGTELDVSKKDDALKQSRKLRKNLQAIIDIDFFPNELKNQVSYRLQQLEQAIARLGEHNEPIFIEGSIPLYQVDDFQHRIWATRQRPWVDRMACAWLISRFIDQYPTFIWLNSPADCPEDAIGFDFDGATFSHIGNLVTFEVLIDSFSLQSPALKRLADIVHFLDAGGIQPAEAIGIESILRGLRQDIHDDAELVTLSSYVFDGLYGNFKRERS